MYDNRFGEQDGLKDRLEDWIHRFSTDKSLPWAGLGLLKDLEAAVVALGGTPRKPDPRQQKLEFDL